MFRKTSGYVALLLIFSGQSDLLAESNIVVTRTLGNNIASHTSSNDFISCLQLSLPSIPTDKILLIQDLDNYTKDIKNNANMALAFNILLQSDTLTAEEKMNWLKQNLSNLPTPFISLMALFEKNLDEAKKIYMLAHARMVIDLDMCNDSSVYEGLLIFKSFVIPKILERFGMSVNNPDDPENESIYNQIEQAFFRDGGFKKFDKDYLTSPVLPYWLACHGIQAFSSQLDESSLFKPQKQYKEVKDKVLKEIEDNASKRGNF